MGWELGYGIWDGIWDMGYGMGYGIWDLGWDLGLGWAYGIGNGCMGWDMGQWDGWDSPKPINMGGKYSSAYIQ